MPLQVIITAANTVSRASVADSSASPDTIRVTISPTSMTVTATASTSEPNGSPTRWATTSAWWTAASTEPASSRPTSTSTTVPGLRAPERDEHYQRQQRDRRRPMPQGDQAASSAAGSGRLWRHSGLLSSRCTSMIRRSRNPASTYARYSSHMRLNVAS